jgi:hypothetical protein
VPELTIVLNHIGGLVRVGPYTNRDNEVLRNVLASIGSRAPNPSVRRN